MLGKNNYLCIISRYIACEFYLLIRYSVVVPGGEETIGYGRSSVYTQTSNTLFAESRAVGTARISGLSPAEGAARLDPKGAGRKLPAVRLCTPQVGSAISPPKRSVPVQRCSGLWLLAQPKGQTLCTQTLPWQ